MQEFTYRPKTYDEAGSYLTSRKTTYSGYDNLNEYRKYQPNYNDTDYFKERPMNEDYSKYNKLYYDHKEEMTSYKPTYEYVIT